MMEELYLSLIPVKKIWIEFDEETLEIYQVVDQDDIPATLNDLTQLQVALTYLAS